MTEPTDPEQNDSKQVNGGPNTGTQDQIDKLMSQAESAITEANEAKLKTTELYQDVQKILSETNEKKNEAEAEVSSVLEFKSQVEQLLKNAKNVLSAINENKDKALSSANEAGESKEKIEQLLQQAQSVLDKANESEELAKNAAAEANGSKENTNQHLEKSKSALDNINALLSQAKTNQDEILSLLEKIKTHSAQTEEIARTADEKDERVDQYEKELENLKREYQFTKEKIDGLLPGATGVGLAKAFNIRKKALIPTKRTALGVFSASVLGFILVGVWAISCKNIGDWNEFFVFLVERSPIILGLVVLEEFGRRLYGNTMKLEEDYAYKETLSMAFEGYKEAMSDVQTSAKDTLTHVLSSNILGALKERPGRFLEEPDDSMDKSMQDVLLSQNETGMSSEPFKLIRKTYEDLKKNLKGSIVKIILIIAVAIAIGYAIGHYSPNIFVNDEGNKTSQPSVQIDAQ